MKGDGGDDAAADDDGGGGIRTDCLLFAYYIEEDMGTKENAERITIK